MLLRLLLGLLIAMFIYYIARELVLPLWRGTRVLPSLRRRQELHPLKDELRELTEEEEHAVLEAEVREAKIRLQKFYERSGGTTNPPSDEGDAPG